MQRLPIDPMAMIDRGNFHFRAVLFRETSCRHVRDKLNL